MCGFTGIYNRSGEAVGEKEVSLVCGAQHALRHRGPDESGFYRTDTFVLGFVRLSLVSINKGQQPYTGKGGRFVTAFNGEIYNFRELSRKYLLRDTVSEVELVTELFASYGVEIFGWLRGMFALVIYDTERREVFAARDRFGIKPFYYVDTADAVCFGSEIKGLPVDKETLQIDKEALNYYCTFQYVPDPKVVYREVHSLPGGHYIRFSEKGSKLYCFAPKKFDTKNKMPRPVKMMKIREALEESVGLCMNGDTETGTFLSAGVDSSIITALAARINPKLKAFTIGFDCDSYPSETAVARRTAECLGIELVEGMFTAGDFMAAFDRVMYHLDSPMADPSVIGVYLLAQLASRQVKSVLSGEGADELFGGYKVYRSTARTAHCGVMQPCVDFGLRRLSKLLPKQHILRQEIADSTFRLAKRYVGPTSVMGERSRRTFLTPDFFSDVSHRDITAPYLKTRGLDRLQKMQLCDWNLWLPCDILYKADRLSMANSLEVRVPFLDDRVFEIAARLGDADKVSVGQSKVLLREAFADLLPQHVLHRPKVGFPVPVAAWLKDELFDWSRSILNDDRVQEIINGRRAQSLLEKYRLGETDDFFFRQVWLLVVLAGWYRQHDRS